jgi:hypothetical protein
MAREPADRWTMVAVRDFLDRGPAVAVHPAPEAVAEDSTRVLQPTLSPPMGVPPVVPDPAAGAVSPPPDVAPRRRSPWPWVAAVAALVAVGAIVYAVLTAGGGDPSASPPSTGTHGSSRTGGSSGSSSSPPAHTNASAAMEGFLTTYLSTVTQDRHAAWDMLTPSYQQASGGFGSYQGFWRTIATATASNVTADPSNLTVTYDVDYVKTDGSHTTEHHTLQLVPKDSSYLIENQLS